MLITLANDDVTIAMQARTRNVLTLRRNGKWTDTTYWKPEGIEAASRELPKRPFVMPCRNLCDQDLKRVHFTCAMTALGMGCRIRRVYSGKLPAMNELDGVIILKILKNRRFKRVKNRLLKYAITLVENTLLN